MQLPSRGALLARLATQLGSRTKSVPVPRLIPPARQSGLTPSFDGTQIYWELHGAREGRPLVFCYGLICSMNQWRAQLEYFSPHHPCLLLDYRGHHRSQSPQDPRLMNISAVARDVAAVIHAQKFTQPAHIWGHSMGVNVALELAALEPALCQSLILCCGTQDNPFHAMFGSDALEKLSDPLLAAYPDNRELFHAVGGLILSQSKLTRAVAQIAGFNEKAGTRPEDMDAYACAVAAINPGTFFPLLAEMARGMTRGIVPKVQTPSLVVAGARDHVTPASCQRDLAQRLPVADFVEIPLGSHNVQLDFGEYVGLKAREFWRARGLD